MVEIWQGEAKSVGFRLKLDNEPLTPENVTALEVLIGTGFSRSTEDPQHPVAWNDDENEWTLPLTQDDTLKFVPRIYKVVARVRPFGSSDVLMEECGDIEILESGAKKVL